jgi:hypothetical protein
MDKLYRLDRQAFTINSFESASNQRAYWLSKSARERLAAAWYLTCCAWNLDVNEDHPLDRNHFSIRRRQDHAPKHL